MYLYLGVVFYHSFNICDALTAKYIGMHVVRFFFDSNVMSQSNIMEYYLLNGLNDKATQARPNPTPNSTTMRPLPTASPTFSRPCLWAWLNSCWPCLWACMAKFMAQLNSPLLLKPGIPEIKILSDIASYLEIKDLKSFYLQYNYYIYNIILQFRGPTGL